MIMSINNSNLVVGWHDTSNTHVTTLWSSIREDGLEFEIGYENKSSMPLEMSGWCY